jgi:hypothetical protein
MTHIAAVEALVVVEACWGVVDGVAVAVLVGETVNDRCELPEQAATAIARTPVEMRRDSNFLLTSQRRPRRCNGSHKISNTRAPDCPLSRHIASAR